MHTPQFIPESKILSDAAHVKSCLLKWQRLEISVPFIFWFLGHLDSLV